MHYLNKLPGYHKAASGAEWTIFKKLPIIFIIGTALPCAEILYLNLANTSIKAEQQQIIYLCIGLIFSHWFFVGVVFFGCIVVILMKGPAYVADPYQLPQENKKLEQFPHL